MSNEYIQAADDANRLLAGFAAIQTVAAAFAKVGGLQQAEEEARNALEVLQAQSLAAGELRDAARLEADAVRVDIANLQADAQDEARKLVADAQAKADALVNDATALADSVMSDARARLADADGKVSLLADMAGNLRAQIFDHETKLASVKAQAQALFGG